MQTSKLAFLATHPAYGYGRDADDGCLRIDRLRRDEFPQLSTLAGAGVYLDHAGATVHAQTQLAQAIAELQSGLVGNPHSAPHDAIAAARRHVLRFFRAPADDYAVVFTSGATAGIKLVGECFPWSATSTFAHAQDSHTSVLGIRALAERHGATVANVPLDRLVELETEAQRARALTTQVEAPSDNHRDDQDTDGRNTFHLFAFPAECNFSGTRHTLDLVSFAQRGSLDAASSPDAPATCGRWLVLLDAAKFVATHPLDLGTCQPDFVTLSFYKMFGFPTGLGALIVRRDALPLLRKDYYGGGTVANVLSGRPFVRLKDPTDPTRLEDGTVSFLSIPAIRHGLDWLTGLGMDHICEHTRAVTELLVGELRNLRHWNGQQICEVYGHTIDGSCGGPVIACNLRRADGAFVGYAEVHKLAEIEGIRLRVGCCCNPGACQYYLGLDEQDLVDGMAAGHVCGDDVDLVNGRPTGAVRFSVGYMTTFEDIETTIEFLNKYFVAMAPPTPLSRWKAPTSTKPSGHSVTLCKLTLFPIKSCAGMTPSAWPVGRRGLLYDREWAIIDTATAKALTLKDVPELCFLEPTVDLAAQTLMVHCRRSQETLVLPLTTAGVHKKHQAIESVRVCAAQCMGRDVGTAEAAWLSARLGRDCRLVRVAAERARAATVVKRPLRTRSPEAATAAPRADVLLTSQLSQRIGFANQAQFLLISRASVAALNAALGEAGAAVQVSEDAFRANLVVDGCEAFAEDTWSRLGVAGVDLEVTGPCGRCSMINVDPVTGSFDRAPLQVLSRLRRERAQILFGQFLALIPQDDDANGGGDDDRAVVRWLRCGARVNVC